MTQNLSRPIVVLNPQFVMTRVHQQFEGEGYFLMNRLAARNNLIKGNKEGARMCFEAAQNTRKRMIELGMKDPRYLTRK